MKKVSVMVPAYNAENYLAQALDSILEQDYPNVEIVVADDASRDGTAPILRQYEAKYPGKIRAIYNVSNLGITANCNLALSACDGEYVSLFAGDDVMLPGKLRKQVDYLESHPAAVLCYHPVEIFDSDSGETLFTTNQNAREDIDNTADLLMKGGIPGGCSIMVRQHAIPQGGYDSRLTSVSDWLFFLEISTRGPFVILRETLGRYRKHQGGASQLTLQYMEESLRALDLFLTKHPKPEYRRLVELAKMRYVAGECYRQLNINSRVALKLADDVLSQPRPPAKYKILWVVCWLNDKVPGMQALISWASLKVKYVLKRALG